MVREDEIRTGEVAVDPPAPNDSGLVFIGRIHTPWTSRLETRRQGRLDGPTCRIEIFDPWVPPLRATMCWYAGWIASMGRHCSISSPTEHFSRR
jgi:hypothetical protein